MKFHVEHNMIYCDTDSKERLGSGKPGVRYRPVGLEE